jgi:hypothetical protein
MGAKKLSTWNRILLETLIVAQLLVTVKKLSVCYETQGSLPPSGFRKHMDVDCTSHYIWLFDKYLYQVTKSVVGTSPVEYSKEIEM